MDDKLPIWEYEYDEATMQGVYNISLVEAPANGVQAVYFNEELDVVDNALTVLMNDEEERLITSIVIIPNKKIFRKNVKDSGPGYVYFTEDVVKKLQQNFAKQNYNHNSNLNHKDKIEGVYFVESWIVKDPKNDKTSALGFSEDDAPKGSWATTMKVDNDIIWNDYIKSGKINGMSIEAFLDVKKIEKKINMNRQQLQDIIEMSIQRVAMATGMNEFVTKDGTKVYSDELILENAITDADGNPIADADFEIDGILYQTDGQGIIVKAEPVVIEDATTPPADETTTEVTPDEKDAKIAELETKVAELEKMNADLEAKNVELEAKIVKSEEAATKMALETPATPAIKNTPNKKDDEEVQVTGVLAAFRKNKNK